MSAWRGARVLVMPRLGRILLFLLIAAAPAGAQVATATLNADLPAFAKLSFSANSIVFPDGDPDVLPMLDAGPVTITAKARASAGATVSLTVQAADDLRSGIDTIPADALTWMASGPGFTAGTMSRTSPQLVASWSGSGVRVGTQSYRFRNRWTYGSGTYTTSLLYTLTLP